jgi:hypothetical protein
MKGPSRDDEALLQTSKHPSPPRIFIITTSLILSKTPTVLRLRYLGPTLRSRLHLEGVVVNGTAPTIILSLLVCVCCSVQLV